MLYIGLRYIIILSIISLQVVGTYSHVNVRTLRSLLDNEQDILDALHNHILLKESHILKVSSQLEPLSAVVSSRGLRDEYLSNPLNTVTLIRRFSTVWLVLANVMGLSRECRKLVNQTELKLGFRDLARVQITYNLSTKHLADGILEEIPSSSNLTGTDCYWMAFHYYQQHHHREAVQWLEQALTKHDNTVPRHWLLELAVLSHCFSGETNKSAMSLGLLIRDFPRHKPSRDLVHDWHFMLNIGCKNAQQIITKKKLKVASMSPSMTEAYNKLCQGRVKTSPDLKCRYVHYHKRHLRLAPFRLEEMHLDPPVLVFHNAINDKEIQETKKIVYKQLVRSNVLARNGSYYFDPFRTCESAFVYPGESNVLDKVAKRTADMINLDTQFSEAHQITRYGLGGEFLFHTDYFGDIPKIGEYGDRIATILFYLSDVPRGGNTAFLNWKVSVRPQKGSAVLWFNLKRDGTGDESSMHAGCSVLRGTKWMLTKLFNELNNDITMPCGLNRNESYKYFYL